MFGGELLPKPRIDLALPHGLPGTVQGAHLTQPMKRWGVKDASFEGRLPLQECERHPGINLHPKVNRRMFQEPPTGLLMEGDLTTEAAAVILMSGQLAELAELEPFIVRSSLLQLFSSIFHHLPASSHTKDPAIFRGASVAGAQPGRASPWPPIVPDPLAAPKVHRLIPRFLTRGHCP